MKTQWIRSIGCILAVLILSGIMPLAAQDNAERYTTISGVVKDKLNKKKLEYVNVSIPGSSVGTVTNADGEFTLKIPESYSICSLFRCSAIFSSDNPLRYSVKIRLTVSVSFSWIAILPFLY